MDENALPPTGTAPPPVPPPPPVILPPLPPRPPQRGRGWMILALVLLALLGISVLYNASHFATALLGGGGSHPYGRVAGPRLDELVKEDHGAANKIAVVSVNGIISGGLMDPGVFSMVEVIRAQLKRAEEDDRVKAVILRVDSPGGEVMAADEIHRAISEFQSKSRKPVVASMGSLAASGGYYVSAPCHWIIANELTITGSIGVIMSTWNYRGLMDKVGVLPMTFKSGKYKDMLSGSRDPNQITPEERAIVQGLITETYSRFTNLVQEGRSGAFQKAGEKGRPLVSDWAKYADGRVLSGSDALKYGFVDQLGSFEDAVERTKKMVGISSANIIEYQQRYDFADFLHLFGKSEAKTLKVDVGLDAPKLKAGQLYFLSPTYVQ
jgi:protease IV